MPGDSCIHQLISIPRKIYASFDTNPSFEVRYDFQMYELMIFDRVWHEGLINKTKCMGVKGDLPALIESFFNSNDNKHCFEWTRI